jgi:hypothetical protein
MPRLSSLGKESERADNYSFTVTVIVIGSSGLSVASQAAHLNHANLLAERLP